MDGFRQPPGARQTSGHRPDPRTHQADAVEIGLFTSAFLGALTRLIALIEQFDLLELFKRLAQHGLGIFKLNPQLVRGTGQILPALNGCLGVGGIGEVRGIINASAVLLVLDFALQVDRHALEVGDHAFDLRNPSALFVDLKFLQADQRFT